MARTNSKKFHIDVTEDFPHLAGAPIVEAVVQWTARAAKPFPSEAIREELIKRLPDYPEPRRQHEMKLEARFDSSGAATQVRDDSWQGMRFESADKRHVAQFTRNGLTFSRLAPYQNWTEFSKEAVRLWKFFVELAQPSEVERLGVRFINRIVPIEPERVGEYLAAAPKCLEPLGMPMSSFLYQSLHDVPDHPLQINVVRTIQPPAPGGSNGYGLILDIDVFTTRLFPPAEEIMLDYLPKMRWLKDKAFFSLLSKRALKRLEKEGP